MEPGSSQPCSQHSTTCLYPKQDQSSPSSPILGLPSVIFTTKTLYDISLPTPQTRHMPHPFFDLITRVIGRPYIKKIKEPLGECSKRLGDIRTIHTKDHLQNVPQLLRLIFSCAERLRILLYRRL
jgi:hypothetical protein